MHTLVLLHQLIVLIAVIGVGLFLLSLIAYWLFGPTKARRFAEEQIRQELDEMDEAANYERRTSAKWM